MTPLTAYAGQLAGETYQGKLASQVEALDRRPLVVAVLAVLNILVALLALGYAIHSILSTHHEGEEAYLANAFNAIGAFMIALVLVPIAIALIIHAAATWTQRTWTWNSNLAFLGVIGLFQLTQFRYPGFGIHLLAVILLALAGGLAYLWFRPQTRAWYGLS
jgi:hypothetical protein